VDVLSSPGGRQGTISLLVLCHPALAGGAVPTGGHYVAGQGALDTPRRLAGHAPQVSGGAEQFVIFP
jgi:hypothetical protein